MTDEPTDAKGACRPERIAAITLFAEDLQASRDFYQRLLDLPVVFEDTDSFVIDIGGTLVNVLTAHAAAELVAPAAVGEAPNGPRCVLTIAVDNVDATVEQLRLRGVTLLNGPMTRPWDRERRVCAIRAVTSGSWRRSVPCDHAWRGTSGASSDTAQVSDRTACPPNVGRGARDHTQAGEVEEVPSRTDRVLLACRAVLRGLGAVALDRGRGEAWWSYLRSGSGVAWPMRRCIGV